MKRLRLQNKAESPESWVLPYEDINTRQDKISGERFPEITLGICDSCYWCYTCINRKAAIGTCPQCNNKISQLPLSIEETSIIEINKKRGMTLRFDRQLPLR